jgi:hypothetical protein
MTWYYAQGDQRQGPVSDSELDALIAAGTVNENTLVWKDGMANWAPLKEARPAGPGSEVPAGWIRCSATGRYFPPEEIVYLDGKPYSAAAKASVLQGVLQTGTLPSADQNRTGPPWENREQLGFFPAVWETIRGVLTDPAGTFSNMRREGGLGAPMAYYVMVAWVGSAMAMLYQYFFQSGFAALAKSPNPTLQMMSTGIFVVVWIAVLPILLVLGSFIGSGILHLSLMICQGAKQPFETTYRTYCYARGSAAVLLIIPFCGGFASWVWALVALCIGVTRTHEITSGRAVLAVLLPTIVCCVAIAVLGMMFFGFIAAAAQGAAHH